jgi:hypothetical protein
MLSQREPSRDKTFLSFLIHQDSIDEKHATGGPWASARPVISEVTNGPNYKVVLPKRSASVM